jgi:hypothetical protein
MPRHQQITTLWKDRERYLHIGITHIRGHRPDGRDHLEIRALDPDQPYLPLGAGGFHEGSYPAQAIEEAGGPVRYVERLFLEAGRDAAFHPAPSFHAMSYGTQAPRDTPGLGAPAPMDERKALELITCTTYDLPWNSPAGPVTVIVTHTHIRFGGHTIDIGIPPDTPFPVDTFSYPTNESELHRTGGPVGFVRILIASGEHTDYWRDYAARAAQADLFGARARIETPGRPRRRRLKLPAPAR